ncbi:polysaccharide biosynthesis/export family protein [Rubellicoccus peritrichatus]|uniref:SLBB domain-containing protein n=1 Tax=Rubellicoccus peritrichatus TaxID=3080537 RepID=A0AAQ3LF48_9BACT|nr:SLBB domain-containing protein [Puniceicoccus sp. CR14]WOO43419.1 SLBB domain-containing protein [Puniceicoccus sp. CR14]
MRIILLTLITAAFSSLYAQDSVLPQTDSGRDADGFSQESGTKLVESAESRGFSIVENAEKVDVDLDVTRIGRPETMELLDSTREFMLGDRLEYMVAEDREEPIVLFVAEDGRVDVPLIGKVQAKGKNARTLAKDISKLLEVDYYYQATVHISEHRDARTRGQVFVMGQVLDQGIVSIPKSEVMTVSRAILAAGGFTPRSDPTRVTVIRRDREDVEEEKRMEVNVAEILEQGRLDKDLVLQPNDLVFVAMRGDSSGTYTVSGAVRSPGVYPIAGGQDLLLSQAILQAGGFDEFAKGSAVKVVRFDENGGREDLVIDVDEVLEEGNRDADIMVKAGDQIIIPEKWISF